MSMKTVTTCNGCGLKQEFVGDFKSKPCPKCGSESANIWMGAAPKGSESLRRHTDSLFAWAKTYDEARASHAAGEPLIRTICKIAARILFVILVVGVIVGVMV